VAEGNKGRGFLTGLILGGVIGSALTVLIVVRMRQRGRRGAGVGSRAGELASFVKDEVLGGVREVIRRAVDEGREAARKTRSDVEERFKEEGKE
jgi:gas vesicle protein